ncbi:MAG: hypothetical protein ABJJ69_08945 [Paracoccaceae bacterium]
MKNIFGAFFVLLVLTSKISAAETIQIKTGEHQTFTRVVFYVDDSTPWEVLRTNKIIRIEFQNYTGYIDSTRVFSRISQKIISHVEKKENTIELHLNCSCDFELGAVTSSFRYLDISHDNSPKAVVDDKSKFRISSIVLENFRRNSTGNTPLDPNQVSALANELVLLDTPIQRTGTSLSLQDKKPDEILISEFHALPPTQNLIESIGNSLGFLMTKGILQRPMYDREFVKRRNKYEYTSNLSAQNLNIKTTNLSVGEGSPLAQQEICGKFLNFSIIDWKPGDDFAHDVSQLRREIFSEFDEVNISSLEKLAQLYIYNSFGLEARQILKLLDLPTSNTTLLLELSYMVDGDFESQTPMIEKLINCSDFLYLLNVLTSKVTPKKDDEKIGRTLKSLNSLPPHLRVVFGAQLSAVFYDLEEISEAKFVIRSVQRGASTRGTSIDLIAASMDSSEQEDLIAPSLRDIINSNSPMAARSAIQLVENITSDGERVSRQVLDLLSAYAVEYRGQDNEFEIRQAYILSLSSVDNHVQAFNELEHLLDKFGNQIDKKHLLEKMFLYLIDDSSDGSFISSIFEIFPNSDISLDIENFNDLTKRLEDLGFNNSPNLLWPEHDVSIRRVSTALGDNTPETVDIAGELRDPENPTLSRFPGSENSIDLTTNDELLPEFAGISGRTPTIADALDLLSKVESVTDIVSDILK